MISPRLTVLAIQSYGFIENAQDNGSGAVGSRARLLYGAMLVGTGVIPKQDLVAVFPQGHRPDQQHLKEQRPSLGEMMETYLKSRPEMNGVMIQSKRLGFGTIADVTNVYRMVKELGHDVATVHFVSDPVHIKRVHLIWKKVGPSSWPVHYHSATFHRMGWRERLIREPIARLAIHLGADKRLVK